jgi:hypothetical protein
MTAEVVIMNKEAIALAADSAVTMRREGEQEKIFSSANKLFALSKYYPVGVMVFGKASFMDIPWETIIKIYRRKLGNRKFDTLKKYAENFIAFLNNGNPLFPEIQQRRYLYGSVIGYFNNQIKKDIDKKVKAIIHDEGKITNSRVKQITSNVIRKHYEIWEKAGMLPSVPKDHIKKIWSKYKNTIDKARRNVFEGLPISTTSLNQLRKVGASLFAKDIFQPDAPGVVIAGFGEKETFPSVKSFYLEGIVNNKMKYKEYGSTEINFETISAIVPFAQKEMVYTFMEGVDPMLEEYMEFCLFALFDKYPEVIVESIKKLDNRRKRALLRKLKQVSNSIFKHYLNNIRKYRKANYSNPVAEVVAMLPKDELAKMAESLVSLTSFKRKVTPAAETVAGPIDVAVISKGDGFIWIKRKHYFKPELNPQFFAKLQGG